MKAVWYDALKRNMMVRAGVSEQLDAAQDMIERVGRGDIDADTAVMLLRRTGAFRDVYDCIALGYCLGRQDAINSAPQNSLSNEKA